MQKLLALSLLFLGASVGTGKAAIVWMCGMDDNGWPFGDGGGPNASFVQETGTNPLPGSPNNPEADLQGDDDYYFAGLYNTVIPSNGNYTPVGLVPVNEEGAERAFGGTDNDLRYHFNLPANLGPNDTLTITFDPYNLDTGEPTRPVSDPRHGIELYFNGVLVMPQIIIRPAQLDTDITSPAFTLASVNAQVGPGADNIVYLKGTDYNNANGGHWMGIDYVQLDSQIVPEPSAGLMAFFSAIGLTSLLRRRRA